MKGDVLAKLRTLEERLRALRADVKKLTTKQVGKRSHQSEAEALADYWVEDVRSHLEHDFAIAPEVVAKYAEQFKRLHVLSRPNNQVTSYVNCLDAILQNFKNDLVLPIQQSGDVKARIPALELLIRRVPDADVNLYLVEAVGCAQHGFYRAAIVLGWCAAIDRIQRRIAAIGFDKFSEATTTMKAATAGRHKDFKKEYRVTSLNELQDVPEADLIRVIDAMELIDANQAERLRTCLQYRKQSAHPGQAPIGEVHIAPFFSDLIDIVFTNPKFELK